MTREAVELRPILEDITYAVRTQKGEHTITTATYCRLVVILLDWIPGKTYTDLSRRNQPAWTPEKLVEISEIAAQLEAFCRQWEDEHWKIQDRLFSPDGTKRYPTPLPKTISRESLRELRSSPAGKEGAKDE